MSPSCLKLLLVLTLFVIITECRPKLRSRKVCKDDDDCGPGFSCIKTRKGNKMCAKAKAEVAKPSKYKNPSIYNILRWVAWTMGQTNRRPRV